MKKSVLQTAALLVLIGSGFLLTYQGFGIPSIPPVLHLILRFLAGLSAQAIFILNFRNPLLRAAPVIVSTLLALWGGYLLLTYSGWENAGVYDYLADYCTPILGSLASLVIIPKMLTDQED